MTDYVYQYTVKGKRYIYRSSGRFEKSRLHKKVTMVYVKGFPRRAYPERFTALNEWCWGITTLLMGLAFILVILWA